MAFVVAILGFIALVITGLVAGAVAIVKVLRGPRGGQGQMAEDEARTMQEIYQGLGRMEQRIEALETILMDRERQGGNR